jgi:hypothetical protein
MSYASHPAMQIGTTQPFRVSPSTVARYFFHDCERFLRFQATPRAQRKTVGIPTPAYDTSRIMQAIVQSGHTWEETALKTLGKRVWITEAQGALSDRQTSFRRTAPYCS